GLPAAAVDHLPGNEARVIGCQEGNGGRLLLRQTPPLQGLLVPNVVRHFSPVILGFCFIAFVGHDPGPNELPRRHTLGNIGTAWRHCVDPDAISHRPLRTTPAWRWLSNNHPTNIKPNITRAAPIIRRTYPTALSMKLSRNPEGPLGKNLSRNIWYGIVMITRSPPEAIRVTTRQLIAPTVGPTARSTSGVTRTKVSRSSPFVTNSL